MYCQDMTHDDLVIPYIMVSLNLVITGSSNGLSSSTPFLNQCWSIISYQLNLSVIWNKIQNISLTKFHEKMSSWPLHSELNAFMSFTKPWVRCEIGCSYKYNIRLLLNIQVRGKTLHIHSMVICLQELVFGSFLQISLVRKDFPFHGHLHAGVCGLLLWSDTFLTAFAMGKSLLYPIHGYTVLSYPLHNEVVGDILVSLCPSICPSVRQSRIRCPLSSAYSSGSGLSHVKFLAKFQTLKFWRFF